MYSTCLFCKASLGANEALEHFPVGRRIAFDAAKGRLWVVCRACGRWNLTPLEERWEAVEECERLYRGTRLRTSTENIGLARLPAGLDLVRIGRPQRPEFAAWRYGDRFRSRYRRTLLWGAGVWAYGIASLVGGTTFAALTGGAGGLVVVGVLNLRTVYRNYRPVSRVTTAEGERVLVRGGDVGETQLIPSAGTHGWRMQIRHRSGVLEVESPSALQVAGQVFAHWNADGAGRKKVQAAVRELERVDHPEHYFGLAARQLGSRVIARPVEGGRYNVGHLPFEIRLALEMAASEETERQALEGELRLLEAAWREAEEIAAIADTLALPPTVEKLIARFRGPRSSERDDPSLSSNR